jgi:hypothetical protein
MTLVIGAAVARWCCRNYLENGARSTIEHPSNIRYRPVERTIAQLGTETDVEVSAQVLHSAVSTNPGQPL